MLSSFTSSSTMALGAVTLISHASLSLAGLARPHRHSIGHRHAARMIDMPEKRAPAGFVDIPLGEIEMLQSEYTTFHQWIETWFSTALSSDTVASVDQLKQEFQAYDGWMAAWIDSALGNEQPAPPPLPSKAPLPKPTHNKPSDIPPTPSPSQNETESTPTPVYSSPVQSAAPVTTTQQAPPPPPPSSSAPQQPAPPASSSSAAAAPPPSTTPPSGPGTGGGSFNADSTSNVAVYYGQSGATSQVPLSQLCQNPSVDIIVLAFLTTFFGPNNYPTLNFGSACGSDTTAEMKAKGATGLLSCPDLAKDISGCQAAGKKVLLSLGGSLATSAFSSDDQATQFASTLWNLFGDGNGESAGMRPFGDVKIDGFDIDNEDHSTAHYSTFTTALKSLSSSASKKYYLSAAPQCPRPDASIPLDAMQKMDFIFVQFYNNGDCDVGQPGFLDSFKAWSKDLSNGSNGGPKLYVGAPACQECAGQGYVPADQFKGVIEGAKTAQGVANFGGVMLWDGAEAVVNEGFLGSVKGALS